MFRFESVMSVGVDEMSWDDYLEDNYEWTTMTTEEQADYLSRIKEYREKVKQVVLGLLDSTPMIHPICPGSFHWVILMGISHECIHLETSAVIISQVGQIIHLLLDAVDICHIGALGAYSGVPQLHLSHLLRTKDLQRGSVPGGCTKQHIDQNSRSKFVTKL